MTDDDFVFGDDSDEDVDEEALFGVYSDDDSNTAAETGRRFGTSETDETDSRRFIQRIWAVVSGTTTRTVVAALVLACVVVLGLVAYPLVMGALDTGDDSTESGVPDGNVGVGGTLTTTVYTTETTIPLTTNAPTATPTTALPSTTATSAGTAATASPTTEATPTPTPTPVPKRGFPAGTPVETNETNDENAQSAA